jgi:serine protease Do
MKAAIRIALVVLAAAALPAQALEPADLFEQVSPSVWVVRTFDGAERPIGQGSAVVIAPGKLITNCHVLAKSKVVMVRRRNVMYEAKLEHADAPRDLCQLSVEGFATTPARLGSVANLKVGQKVYAIGNPRGLEVTLSEGLVSGLRGELQGLSLDQGGSNVIQTTAPISPGSSGGGLFDTEGRLIGITTAHRRDSQNINIALPVDWIAEVPQRSAAALEKRRAPQVAAVAAATAAGVPPGYPTPGTTWVYRHRDVAYSGRATDVTVRAERVDRESVDESVFIQGRDTEVVRRTVNAREMRFLSYSLGGDASLLEVAPYVVAANEGKAPENLGRPVGYPFGNYLFAGERPAEFKTRVRTHDWEEITVPAGTYRAIRYEVDGERDRTAGILARAATVRFKVNIWYAPEIGRIAKLQHRAWSLDSAPFSDEAVELLEYRAPR